MTYKIVFSDNALSELENLGKAASERIIKKLKSSAANPHRAFVRLKGSKELKLRVGDYRIIAAILHKEETILIIAIGHRKNIYERR